MRRALEYIRAGDIYQVNLSQRFEAACAEDPFDVYLRLRALSPAPFAASCGSRTARCCRRRRSGSCGTRLRPADRDAANQGHARLGAPLPRRMRRCVGAAGEREGPGAENVMIVDLERN